MKAKVPRVVFGIGIVLIVLLNIFLLNPEALRAQDATAALSGTVTDHTGRVLRPECFWAQQKNVQKECAHQKNQY